MPQQTFASSSKLLQKKWNEKRYLAHQRKLHSMRAGVDNSPPKQYPHLKLRLKKVQKEEERQSQIDQNNEILLQKMAHIMKHRGRVDNWNEYETRSRSTYQRDREHDRITEENIRLARQLESVRPKYHVKEWEEDYKRHEYYTELWGKSTKDYDVVSPRSRSQAYRSENYESDFEDTDSTRLPKIESRSEGHRQGIKKQSGSGVAKLPQINKQQSADVDNACKLLFKACKGLAKLDEAILKSLIRKGHAQRMATKTRFYDMYDLELQTELDGVTDGNLSHLVKSLLTSAETRDAENINKAIHNDDVNALVELVCSLSSTMTSIRKTYKDEYEVSIEDDIQDRITDEESNLFLLSLLQCNGTGDDIDDELADEEAERLFQDDNDRFLKNGSFLRLFGNSSLIQVQATMGSYRMVSGGRSVPDTMKIDRCSKEYVEAVTTMDKCLSSGAALFADKLHTALKGGDFQEVTNILLSRSQVDLPDIRKAYKRKYKCEVVDDIRAKIKGDAGSLLAHLANRQVKGQSKKQGKENRHENQQTRRKDDSNQRKPHPPPGQKKGAAHVDKKNDKAKETSSRNESQERTARGEQKNDRTKESSSRKESHESTAHGEKKNDKSKETSSRKGSQAQNKDEQTEADEEDDVGRVHKAVDGIGTDERTLIDVIARRSNDDRQELKRKYKDRYDKDLSAVLKSELRGDLEEVMLGLLMIPAAFDAFCLHDAMKGLGTREAALIGIMCTRTPSELKQIKKVYKEEYGNDLADDLEGDTSGAFREMLLLLVEGSRDQSEHVDSKQAEEDAAQLYQGEDDPLDVKGDTFKNLLTKANRMQVIATFEEYEKLSNLTMEEAICKIMAGDNADGYVSLVQALRDPVEFYAKRLHEAMAGRGTNDMMLIRIIVSRSEIDLADISTRYNDLYATTLRESVKDECQGDYRECLLALLDRK